MKKSIFLFLALSFPILSDAQDTMYVNSAVKYQTIKGWGGEGGQNTQFENTPGYLITQIINESVDDLGLTNLRYECYQGSDAQSYGMCRTWEWTNDDGSPDTTVWSAFDTVPVDNYMQNLFIPWKNQVVADGMPFTFYVDPSWYIDGSTGDIPAFLRYSPGEYSEYLISNLEYLKRKYGLVADYTTICNEAGNNNEFTSGLVDTMIKTVGVRLAQAGLTTTIQFPECVSAQTSWNYISALATDTAIWSKVKCLSYHLYGTNDPYRSMIDSFAQVKGIPTAQTEYIGLGIDLLYQDLTWGGVSYWDFYGNGDYMPLNTNDTWFTYGAKYWTTRNVIHYNPPGSVRISAVSNDTARLKPLAFDSGGKITATILNDKTGSITENITVSGLPNGIYGACQTLTSGTPSELGLFTVSSGIVTVPVAQNSVVTLYPHTVNLPPVAISWAANPTYIETPTTSVALSASAMDPELSTVYYHWSVDSFPTGATVVLSNPNISNPTVTGMTIPGDYVFAISMSDGADSTKKTLTVMAFSGNQAPEIVELQSRIPTIITLPIDTTVLKAFAQDLEGDALTYQYSIVSQPVGAAALFVTPVAINTTVRNMTIAGDYTFQFSVTDGMHTPVTRNILVTVYPLNNRPVIDSIWASPAIVYLPSDTTILSANTHDPDGDIITHWWSVKSAPVGAFPAFDEQGERITGLHNMNIAGTYVFTLTAVDRTLYARKDVTVVVNVSTGINPIKSNPDLQLFPNPADDELTVATSYIADDIQITNLVGQVILNINHPDKKTNAYQLDVSSLSSGVYFLTMNSEEEMITKKFIIIR